MKTFNFLFTRYLVTSQMSYAPTSEKKIYNFCVKNLPEQRTLLLSEQDSLKFLQIVSSSRLILLLSERMRCEAVESL